MNTLHRLISRTDRDTVERALAELPDRQHHAIRARWFHGHDWEGIGYRLDISGDVARLMATRGLRLVRSRLRLGRA